MDNQNHDGDDLECSLLEYVDQLSEKCPENRERLTAMARALHARRLPVSFIFASLRSSAAILADEEEESASQEAMQRQEVQQQQSQLTAQKRRLP